MTFDSIAKRLADQLFEVQRACAAAIDELDEDRPESAKEALRVALANTNFRVASTTVPKCVICQRHIYVEARGIYVKDGLTCGRDCAEKAEDWDMVRLGAIHRIVSHWDACGLRDPDEAPRAMLLIEEALAAVLPGVAMTQDPTPVLVDHVLRDMPIASADEMLAEVMKRGRGRANADVARRLIRDAKRVM